MPSQINQKTVAKNTLMLYIRMGVMMIVSLYTSRVVLATLGVDDFGIYNVVGGVVVMFSFMNTTLTVAIRRFLAYELGQEGGGRIQKIFNASIIAVFITSIIIVIGLESIGLWFLNNKLNIPPDRMAAANVVFQFSILSFFFNMNLIPFNSAIVVYEKMEVYAYFGIVEAVLKLGLVLALPLLLGDKLQWYGFLIAFLAILMAFCNYLYCRLKIISPRNLLVFKWLDVLSIFKFSAWTIFGTMVLMLATQGVNMIYNVFFGVAINAALGIAQHVASAANQFVGNFQTAFNPQLTKSYSSEGLSERTFDFVCHTSKLSFFLIMVICVPVVANTAPILEMWLKEVPDYAVPFTVLYLLYMAIDGASGPLSYLVYAKGELRFYQIFLSAIQVLYFLSVWVLCKMGFPPTNILFLNVVTAVALYFARLIVLKKILEFPMNVFIKRVIKPLFIPIMLYNGIVYLNFEILQSESMLFDIFKIISTIILALMISFFIYLNHTERTFVYSILKRNSDDKANY